VDDGEALTGLYVDLTAHMARVDTALDGVEALEKIRSYHYDVVVADYVTPKMNGLDLFNWAIAYDLDLAAHFVFCSAAPSDELVPLCEERGLPLLRKPIGTTKLFEAVADAERRSSGLPGKDAPDP
jgi:CheY-like chemotaxis protein